MQTASRQGQQPNSRQRQMAPVLAFGIGVAILASAALGLSLSREESPPSSPVGQAAAQLTETQASDRVVEIQTLLTRASQERDVTLLPSVLTEDSPLNDIARREIEQLIHDGVIDRSRLNTVSLQLRTNTPNEIVAIQQVAISPKFILEKSGKDITDSEPIKQTVRWVLHPEDGEWQAFRIVVIKSGGA